MEKVCDCAGGTCKGAGKLKAGEICSWHVGQTGMSVIITPPHGTNAPVVPKLPDPQLAPTSEGKSA